jgi:hypothetical protein
MKNLLFLVFMVFCNISYSQEIKFSELSAIKQRSEFTSYVGSDGGVYKIGDKIRIGVPSSNKTFAFIWEGDGILVPMTPLNAVSSGQETEIKRIIVAGSKRTGYSVTMRTKGFIGISNYTIQFENALATGEIKGSGMTSDDALAELKKAKDKLDLGLITQEQYDQIKSDLTKFIK